MAEEYVKTSKEELTAMAMNLRKSGSFDEGQKFVFPSKYAKPATITYWIYSNNNWIEKTAGEAEALVEGGASILEVEERPETGENNTVYQVFTYQMGFKEAYEKAIHDLYMKIAHGTLTQEDVDGVIFGENSTVFSYKGSFNRFSNINTIKIKANLLRKDTAISKTGIKNIEITDPENITRIGRRALFNNPNLVTISDAEKFLEIQSEGCAECSSLTNLEMTSLQVIENSAFYKCTNLTILKLPAIPPDLKNVNAFQMTSYNSYLPNLTILVPTGTLGDPNNPQDLLDNSKYVAYSNWNELITNSTITFAEY